MRKDAFHTPELVVSTITMPGKQPVRPANKKPAEKQYLWVSLTFIQRSENDSPIDGSIFHGVFTTKELALDALNVQDHLDHSAVLEERENATDVVYKKGARFGSYDSCAAQVFKIIVNRPEHVDL